MDNEDYHQNMNGEIFLSWAKRRLCVAFKQLYSDKKMILVLDNAAYHHWKGKDSWTVGGLNKIGAADKLESLCGLKTITVERAVPGTNETTTHTFPSHTWYHNGKKRSPTLDEIKSKLKEQLKLRPELHPSLVRKLFTQQDYKLIYTPPYLPEVQPIERAWAYVKNYVASQFQNGRKMYELKQQVFEGMYGDEKEHAPLDATLAEKIISHSHDSCNSLIDEDDVLCGTIDALTTAGGNALPEPDEEKDMDDDLDPFADAEDSDDEKEEDDGDGDQ